MRHETLQAVAFGKCYIGIAEIGADGVFISLNERYAEMLGYSRFEIEGRLSFQDITHPADVQVDVEQARQVREGEISAYPMTKRYWTKTEELLWAEIYVEGVFKGGLFSHYAVQCRPVMRVHLPRRETKIKHTGANPLRWLRDNWPIVASGTTAIGLIVAEVIRQIGRGAPNG